jgi:hypothetical protein
MYTKQVFFLLAVAIAIANALPVVEKRYTLLPGMSPIKALKRIHAYKRDDDNECIIDLSKRVVIVDPNGMTARPEPVGPSHNVNPQKRYIIENPDGTVTRPQPVAPGHVVPEKRSNHKREKYDGSFIRSEGGTRGETPFKKI